MVRHSLRPLPGWNAAGALRGNNGRNGGSLTYHVKLDFTRETAELTVLYVVEVKDCTLAALWSDDTSSPKDAELDTVEKVVLVNDWTEAPDCKLETISPSEAEDEIVLKVVDVKLCAEAPEIAMLIAERPEETVEKVVEVKLWTLAPDWRLETTVSVEVAVEAISATETAFESAVLVAELVAAACDFTAPLMSSAWKP